MRSVRSKLIGSFVIILAFVVVLGYSALLQVKKMNEFTNEISGKWMKGSEIINKMNFSVEQYVSTYYQTLAEKNPERLQALNATNAAVLASIDEGIADYKKLVLDDSSLDGNTYALVEAAWSRFKSGMDTINSEQAAEADKKRAEADVTEAFTELRTNIDGLAEFNRDGVSRIDSESKSLYLNTSSLIFYMGIAIVVVVGLLAWLLIRNLTRPLVAATATMNRISAGDLTVEPMVIDRKDEFGVMMEAVNQTVANLKRSVKQMQESSASVAVASAQMFASSEQNTGAARHVSEAIQQVAAGSENQAGTAVECGRVVDEMAEGVQRIAETTGSVSALSASAAHKAGEGADKIVEVSARMHRLSDSVAHASEAIARLERQSLQIGEMSAQISALANQTNLLALNAAIEAARAGEHGKGFAVVAAEVRKLAAQSNGSSQGIIELIESIQQDTVQAVDTMNRSLAEVQEGVLAVTEAEQAFKEIVQSTGEVSASVQETAAAAEQLAASSEEVAASIANMGNLAKQAANMSQQVAATTEEQLASSEEMTSASQNLSGIAKDLQNLVRKFKLETRQR